MKICKLLQSCMRAAILFESISFSPQQFHTCYVYMYIVYYVLFIHCYCNLPIFSQLRDRKLSCTDKISISIIVRRQYGTSFTVARNSQPHTHTHTKASRVVRRQRWPAPAEESAWCWDSTRSTHTVTDIHRDAPPAHDFSLNQVVSWIDFWFNIKIKAYIITYIYLYMCEWVYTCVYCYVVMWKCIMCSSLCCGGICANVCEFSVRRRDMRFGLNYQNETNEKDGWVLPANLWIQPVVGWESKAQSVFNHTHTHIHHCTSRSTLTSAYMTWPEVM